MNPFFNQNDREGLIFFSIVNLVSNSKILHSASVSRCLVVLSVISKKSLFRNTFLKKLSWLKNVFKRMYVSQILLVLSIPVDVLAIIECAVYNSNSTLPNLENESAPSLMSSHTGCLKDINVIYNLRQYLISNI